MVKGGFTLGTFITFGVLEKNIFFSVLESVMTRHVISCLGWRGKKPWNAYCISIISQEFVYVITTGCPLTLTALVYWLPECISMLASNDSNRVSTYSHYISV